LLISENIITPGPRRSNLQRWFHRLFSYHWMMRSPSFFDAFGTSSTLPVILFTKIALLMIVLF
jgi:hypothetical protein